MATRRTEEGPSVFSRARGDSARRSTALALALVGLWTLGGGCSGELVGDGMGASGGPLSTSLGTSAGKLIALVDPDQARYAPGATATLYVDLFNQLGVVYSGSVTLSVAHLGEAAAPDQMQAVGGLAPGSRQTLIFQWTTPARDFTGYHVVVKARAASGQLVDSSASAVDVSSDWTVFPRYGFVSRFDGSYDPYHVAWQAKNHHINGLQFYDWQWKQHVPYSAKESWPDIANRTNLRSNVSTMITAAHDYNIRAMNYNLMYGAYGPADAANGYGRDGSGVQSSWGLFTDSTQRQQLSSANLPSGWATRNLALFDPNHLGWRGYIFGRERDAFDHYAFDGWHIDQLGIGGGFNSQGNWVDLADSFARFISAAKGSLGRRVLFNSLLVPNGISGLGQDQVAQSGDVDFVYVEVWDPRFTALDATVQRAVAVNDTKPVVLAAYVNHGCTRSPMPEPEVRLADGAIAAVGASHIELGDGEKLLCHEYFPHNGVMSDPLHAAISDHYHFETGYENLLRDRVKRGNLYVTSGAFAVSANAQPRTVWTIARSAAGADVWHFINLLGNVDGQWLDSTHKESAPPDQVNATVRLYYEGNPAPGAALHLASPDFDHGEATTLPFRFGSDAIGAFVETTLPRLRYWDMLWLDKMTGASEPALFDDFENPIVRPWQSKAGSWSVVGTSSGQHQMQVNQGGGILKWLPGLNIGDYSVEADVTVNSTVGNGALLARMQLDGGFYQVEIKSGTTWAIYKHDGADGSWRELISGSFNYPAGSTHHLKLACIGSTLRAEIDRQPMGAVRDLDHPFYRGTVGLRSESQQVAFDNVLIHAN